MAKTKTAPKKADRPVETGKVGNNPLFSFTMPANMQADPKKEIGKLA